MPNKTLFFTLVSYQVECRQVLQLVASLRHFGGDCSASPFWIFGQEIENPPTGLDGNTHWLPFEPHHRLHGFFFGDVAAACAQAEKIALGVESLVWMDQTCLFSHPPHELSLGDQFDAAVRPVHLRNIGQRIKESPDSFWREIYARTGDRARLHSVRSFVEGEEIRAYFNFHSMAVRPELGIFQKWVNLFEQVISDDQFLAHFCGDELHRIFLFQAILSATIEAEIDWQRIRILPGSYNYPLHLHRRVTPLRRAKSIADLVTFTNEGEPIDFRAMGIELSEPFKSWYESLYKIGGK